MLRALFLDRNECLTNGTGCHANATCVNFDGGHSCVCNKGYYGNGTNCTGKCIFMGMAYRMSQILIVYL